MHIEFIYRYVWNGEDRAYYVTYDDGAIVAKVFSNGEIGAVVNPIPATRLTEIEAHIDMIVNSSATFIPKEET
jgi:hypothetical protein